MTYMHERSLLRTSESFGSEIAFVLIFILIFFAIFICTVLMVERRAHPKFVMFVGQIVRQNVQ